MSSALAGRWTICDRLLQKWRYRMVVPHIPAGGVVADLGCGSGGFLHHISRMITSGVGIDTEVPTDSGKLTFRATDLNRTLPLETGYLDTVTSLAVIEHLTAPATFVTEIHRILKHGGVCILTTPAPAAKPLLEFLAYRLKVISKNDIRDHKHYFDETELRELFGAFRSVEIRRFQFGLNILVIARR